MPLRPFIASLALLLTACAATPYRWSIENAELRSAIGAASEATIRGPALVRLAPKTVLELQADLVFVPPAEGVRLLRAIGQGRESKLLGLVISYGSHAPLVAAIYTTSRTDSEIPEIEVVGWNRSPALAGFYRY